jgi:hypothetical protein
MTFQIKELMMFTMLLSHTRRSARAALLGGLSALAIAAIIPLSAFAAAPKNLCAPADYKCVIKYGDAAIADRQSSLSILNGRVTLQFKAGRITSSDNATLTGDIASNETGLSALKTKLDGDTNATSARADYKSIFTTYRIYAVVLPRDYNELLLDMIVHADARLQSEETVIQDAINGAPAGVQQQATTLFNDYKTQVTNSQAQASAARQIIPQLTPSAFNADPIGYRTTYDSYKTDTHTASLDTRIAINDLHQIIQLLKSAA